MTDVVGVVSGVVGIYQFLEGLIPGKQENNAVVRIAAGLASSRNPDDSNSGGLDHPDGEISSVLIYNNNQELLSVSENNKYIGDGDYHDFTLIQDNKQQAPFVQIRGSADDVCVAYVSATFVDGQKRGWDASWGKAFNMHWYYSGVYPGEDSSQYVPLP